MAWTVAIVVVGVNTGGRCEVLGVATGPSEAGPFWKACCDRWRIAACAGSSWSSPMITRDCAPPPARRSPQASNGIARTGCATRLPLPRLGSGLPSSP